MRSEARIGDIWSQVRLVLEDGRPREAPCLMGGLAGGGSRADSADTTALVRRGVQERKRLWGRSRGAIRSRRRRPGRFDESRSEERRVGKESRSRCSPYNQKNGRAS